MAPATRPETPATSMPRCVACAAATPSSRLAVDTMPSLAPNTAARNQPVRCVRCCSLCSIALLDSLIGGRCLRHASAEDSLHRLRSSSWLSRTFLECSDIPLKCIADWRRQHRHEPVRYQRLALKQKLAGYFAYFGVTGNCNALISLRFRVIAVWWKWLSRRSQRALSWEKMLRLLERYPLPEPRIRPANVA